MRKESRFLLTAIVLSAVFIACAKINSSGFNADNQAFSEGPSSTIEEPVVILKLERGPGFRQERIFRVTEITSDGIARFSRRNDLGETLDSQVLAQLEPQSLETLTSHIQQLDAAAPLVDLTPKKPLCMDVPSEIVTAHVGNQDIIVQQMEKCHTFSLEHESAKVLSAFIYSLESLQIH